MVLNEAERTAQPSPRPPGCPTPNAPDSALARRSPRRASAPRASRHGPRSAFRRDACRPPDGAEETETSGASETPSRKLVPIGNSAPMSAPRTLASAPPRKHRRVVGPGTCPVLDIAVAPARTEEPRPSAAPRCPAPRPVRMRAPRYRTDRTAPNRARPLPRRAKRPEPPCPTALVPVASSVSGDTVRSVRSSGASNVNTPRRTPDVTDVPAVLVAPFTRGMCPTSPTVDGPRAVRSATCVVPVGPVTAVPCAMGLVPAGARGRESVEIRRLVRHR